MGCEYLNSGQARACKCGLIQFSLNWFGTCKWSLRVSSSCDNMENWESQSAPNSMLSDSSYMGPEWFRPLTLVQPYVCATITLWDRAGNEATNAQKHVHMYTHTHARTHTLSHTHMYTHSQMYVQRWVHGIASLIVVSVQIWAKWLHSLPAYRCIACLAVSASYVVYSSYSTSFTASFFMVVTFAMLNIIHLY